MTGHLSNTWRLYMQISPYHPYVLASSIGVPIFQLGQHRCTLISCHQFQVHTTRRALTSWSLKQSSAYVVASTARRRVCKNKLIHDLSPGNMLEYVLYYEQEDG